MIREKERKVPSGYLMLVVLLVLQLASFFGVFLMIRAFSIPGILATALISTIILILWAGFFMVHPNEARGPHASLVCAGRTRFTPRMRSQRGSEISRAAS